MSVQTIKRVLVLSAITTCVAVTLGGLIYQGGAMYAAELALFAAVLGCFRLYTKRRG